MVFHTLVSQNNNALLFKIKMRTGVFEPSRAITANGFGLNAGRVSDALNCQPTTNLQKKY
jgi:hypothetical protein